MVDVSVIIPAYNMEPYLKASVKTAIEQTHTNLEIILIDDGSTDRTGIICDELAAVDARIKVIHKQNGGVGAARNTGLDAACGRYVFFSDADDLLEPDLIKDNLSAADSAQADIVVFGHGVKTFSDGRFQDGARVCLPALAGDYSRREFEQCLKTSVLFSLTVWSRLFRRAFLTENGLRFTGQVIGEDALFNIEALSAFEHIAFVQKVYYYHVQRSQSAMARYQPRMFEYEYNVAKKLQNVIEQSGCESAALRELSDNFYFRAVCIVLGNLCVNACPLSFRQKRKALEEILDNVSVKGALSRMDGQCLTNKTDKIKAFLLKNRMCRTALLLSRAKKRSGAA